MGKVVVFFKVFQAVKKVTGCYKRPHLHTVHTIQIQDRQEVLYFQSTLIFLSLFVFQFIDNILIYCEAAAHAADCSCVTSLTGFNFYIRVFLLLYILCDQLSINSRSKTCFLTGDISGEAITKHCKFYQNVHPSFYYYHETY